MRLCLLLFTLLLAGCGREPAAPAEDLGLVFLALDVETVDVMQALFSGRIVADDAGCLRFDSSEPATVIWPKGFSLGTSIEGVIVRNSSGVEIGRIGDSFRIGGGFVPSLDGIGLISEQTRQLAYARCPGQYWIVGETL